MKTNKLVWGMSLTLLLFGPTLATTTVNFTPTLNPGDPEFRLGGGEMWVHVVSGSLGIYGAGDAFATFCVEIDEELDFVAPALDAVINPAGAIQGGVGGSPDPISDHTAWLFEQFYRKTLPFYEFDGTVDADNDGVLDRKESAIAMQNLLWGLEDEILPLGVFLTVAEGNALAANFSDGALQQKYFDLADAAIQGGWTNNGQIQVANIYALGTYDTGNPVYKQDVLVIVPAPGAIGLVLFGTGMLGYFRRMRSM